MTDDNTTTPTSSGPGCGGVALYILSAIIVLFTVGMIAVYALLFINPDVPFNPFPPPTLPATAAFPTGTPTSVLVLPPTWTLTPTSRPGATATGTATLPPGTLPPTLTPVVAFSATPTILPPTYTATVPLTSVASATPAATATAIQTPTATPYPVALQPSGVVATQAPNPHVCPGWTGVGGQVFGPNNGAPITGLLVHLEGKWSSKSFSMDAITGSATSYGPGGYEFSLGTAPVASQGTLWVQVRDANGLPLSDKVSLTTYGDCAHNLLLVNFNQIH